MRYSLKEDELSLCLKVNKSKLDNEDVLSRQLTALIDAVSSRFVIGGNITITSGDVCDDFIRRRTTFKVSFKLLK